ncbi:MAG: sulfatase [Bacteroidia bacterium]
MKVRSYFKVLVFLSGAILLMRLETAARPNIIFILTDDQRYDAIGFSGNPYIQTPEMDRLASEGTWFRKAFVTTPICAASRASILTGMYERTHGYTFQQPPLAPAYCQMMYPNVLKQNGYYTGFLGKLGVVMDHPEQYFDVASFYDRSNFPDKRGYFYQTIDEDTVHLTAYTGYLARKFLDSLPPDKPFCLSLSFSAPHAHDPAREQYFWQPASDRRYSETVFPLPECAADSFFLKLPEEVRAGFNRERWYWRYDTPEKYQHSMRGYYRMIGEIDDELGLIRKKLKEKKLEDNTVIILMGDNGYFTGERQLAGKWLMYEHSIHVPLIIFDPAHPLHAARDEMVLNIDVSKTILQLAGVSAPDQYQGKNLIPLLGNESGNLKRKHILLEHLWDFKPIPSSEAIRTEEWKYMRFRQIVAPEELYNLKTDPGETHNLAGDPDYQKILKKLRKTCDREIAAKLLR